jgi:adenylylsulfate kinase
MNGTRKRSMAKAISWRFIATITGAAIVYFLTGEFEDAGKFIILDVILKLMFYYGHERAWMMVEWGFEEEPAADSA